MQTRIIEGVVILEHPIGESDKYITVLTYDLGRVEIFARGAHKITSKNHAATQSYVYSRFGVTVKNDKFYLNSSEIIRDFYNIRLDIRKLALAYYISDVMRYAVTSNNVTHESVITRIVLNCFHMLDTDKRSCEFVKSVFELRFMTEIGYMPTLIGCDECYKYDADVMFFMIDKTKVYCEEHFFEKGYEESFYNIKINPGVFNALQFIFLSDIEKLFNFRVSHNCLVKLNEITEKYICTHLSRGFKSLDYYNSVS